MSTHMTPRASTDREGGFTLAEMLVAVTVMAIVFIVVFSLYDSLQKSFKLSENAATQQQNTRVAFDRMVADVRMAGFNHNPDGDPNRPDEQIEGMWDTAITVRGDYDFEDPNARVAPEAALGGPSMPFRAVSTGNDEIVTYALGKPGGTGGTSISFVADVQGVPRNGSQETVSIGNVHTTQSDPPYTLYRYIVSPNSTSVVKQPVADNIKSMVLTYYDSTGGVLSAIGGAEDPNDIEQRKKIAKVGIQVVGMTEDPDLAYIDPTDPNAQTQHYRKFTLQTDVTPRNLGFVGVVDIDLDDPNAPVNFTACQGHCDSTYLKWQSGGDPDVASYTVSWGTSVSNMTNVVSTTDLFFYVAGITGPHYYAARTIDMVGNQSANAMVGPSTPNDTTTPAQVTGTAATGDGGGSLPPAENQVNVSWAPCGGNTTNLSCDDPPYPIRDLMGYRVYKGATAGFDPNVPAQVLQSWDPNAIPATVNALIDPDVVNCRPYYYKVRAEDECAKIGAVSAVADGSGTTTIPPSPPTSVSATDMGLGYHRVTWNRVSQNSAAPPSNIVIDRYAVHRAVVNLADDPNLASYATVWSGIVPIPSAPEFNDPNVPSITSMQRYWYKISAMDDCPNESDLSLPDEADRCNFGGSISMSVIPGGATITGAQTITLNVSGGVATQASQLVIKDVGTGTVVHSAVDNTPPYSYVWNSSSVPSGRYYQIIGFVTNTSGCAESTEVVVTTASSIPCCIAPNSPTISPTTGAVKANELYYDIVNNCGDDVHISQMIVEWTNNAGQNALFDLLQYNIFSQITGSRTFDLVPNQPTGVKFDYTVTPLAPELELDQNNDASAPVRLQYVFTRPVLNKVGATWVGETIQTSFFFSVDNQSGTGRCNITVVTNPLSLLSCDPATDPNCN